MEITSLDHVNLRTTRLDEMIDWYCNLLGMRVGPRPPFPFPGAWLYVEENAFVHLVGVEAEATGSDADLKLEHFAFSATGLDRFEAHLKTNGVSYRRVELTAIGTVQLNVWDPDGNHIHIDFRTDE
ncbi:VOC family protein [Ruegeria sp. HKCCD7559]|uniref:VOC family protein n=1 Tax=Ruegeria sp. HKCCD7559 TaxID=2683005 RepID=UPI001490EF82|nr:VOC family protein [Ruegeria sp. HKCCD7559]NOC45330.1 glyoxalase [Ruegeria sp. HKCCD7559]